MPHPPRWLAVLALIALAAGCNSEKKLIDKLPKMPRVDLSSLPLPKDGSGLYQVFQTAGGHLGLDPTVRDPITAVGACADLVTWCYQQGGYTLDDCVGGVTICQTDTPWNESQDCCPRACMDAFAKERKQGTDALAAFEKIYFDEPDCFPGVRAALEAP